MNIPFYMDVHVPKAVVLELRKRGIDAITAQEDGAARLPDELLLQRATELGRVLVSQDIDLVEIAARCQNDGIPFAGVVFARQRVVGIGGLVRDLELVSSACEAPELRNQILHLPL